MSSLHCLTIVLFIAFMPLHFASLRQDTTSQSSSESTQLSGQVAKGEISHCGHASCFLLMRRLGLDVSQTHIYSQFDAVEEKTTFEDLQRVLSSQGVETIGLRVSLDRVRSLSTPCIVQVRNPSTHFEHFQVLEPYGGGFIVLDPEFATPILLTPEAEARYAKVYSGMALLLTTELTWLERHGHVLGVSLIAAAVVLVGLTLWGMVRLAHRTQETARSESRLPRYVK